MEENKVLLCDPCQTELKVSQVFLNYLGSSFHADLLKCPKCGQVYIPEDLVKNRVAEVEMQLEDK